MFLLKMFILVYLIEKKKTNFIILMYLQYFVYLQMILCMSQCLGGSTGPAQQPIKKVIKETKP